MNLAIPPVPYWRLSSFYFFPLLQKFFILTKRLVLAKILILLCSVKAQEEIGTLIGERGMTALPPKSDLKKEYNSPKITTYGKVEEITGWLGGPWGEFFCGPISGWNPGDPNTGS